MGWEREMNTDNLDVRIMNICFTSVQDAMITIAGCSLNILKEALEIELQYKNRTSIVKRLSSEIRKREREFLAQVTLTMSYFPDEEVEE
jgi:hypothetical protein